MIRRGFWLVAGAALGVAGYRRVTRLARELGVPVDGPAAASRQPGDARQVRGRGNLTGRPRHQAPARPRGAIASAVAAVAFVRDVREGMTEYWSLRRGELARTLGSQTDPVTASRSGRSDQRAPGR